MNADISQVIRVDKWLCFARFFKTRGLAAKVVAGGGVRINGVRISKPSANVRIGDTLSFMQARQIRVVRVLMSAERRGPAASAVHLYEDLSPPPAPRQPAAPRYDKGGRPTKKDRRDMDSRDARSD